MKRLGLSLGTLFALALPAQAGDGAGTTAFHFLNLGTSARVEAMGGTGTTLAEGADALGWNPARMHGSISEIRASAFTWLSGVQSGTLGGIRRLGPGTLGIGVRSLFIEDVDNVVGESVVGQDDFALSAGYGLGLTESLSAGVTGRFLQSKLDEETASSVAADLGLNYRYVTGWDLVAAARNLGSSAAYGSGAKEQLPSQMALGLGGTLGELRFGTEGIWENGPGWSGRIGAEYALNTRIWVRAGSRLGEGSSRANDPYGIGLGILAREGLEVDYSFRNGVFDPSHRLGVRWTLPGDSTPPARMARTAKEFYLDVVTGVLDESMGAFPSDVGDTVYVRPTAQHEAGKLLSTAIADRLRSRGMNVIEPGVAVVPSENATEEEIAILNEAGKGPILRHPALEFEVVSSTYEILGFTRARWIGPKTIRRRAEVDLAMNLYSADTRDVAWSSAGQGEDKETVSDRIPTSAGYPQANAVGGGAKKKHPLVEPAIVTGIVTGLAIIFFSNRDVGN